MLGDVSCATKQAGAALLAAMLTVTLVATFAAAALWQQWRGVEVETAERARVQATWILTGAFDWARLILREDALSGGSDHLGEPWAVPLNEVRVSSFLATDKNASNNEGEDENEIFLSGQIGDLQARLNVTNLIDGGQISEPDLAAFRRLFMLLSIPVGPLNAMADKLLTALKDTRQTRSPDTVLMPQHVSELGWLGLSPETLVMLTPYITLLPVRTPVNLNTASAEVIYANTPGIELSEAQALVSARQLSHFRSLLDAEKKLNGSFNRFSEGRHSVTSKFFEVRGQLRLDHTVIKERSMLRRDGLAVRTLRRDRGVDTDWPKATSAAPSR